MGLVLPDRPQLPVAERGGADDAPEPIQELLAARSKYARVLRWVPGDSTGAVSLRDYAAGKDVALSGTTAGIGDGGLPMYLLLYGGPDVLPWGLQYQLNAGRFVGRLDLTGEALSNYVDALLTGFPAGNYAAPVVWSVDHGGDDMSSVMRDQIGARSPPSSRVTARCCARRSSTALPRPRRSPDSKTCLWRMPRG